MKDISYGYVTITAILAISLLETVNMVTLHHNGNVLSLCIIVIAGLGGYTIKYLENYVKEKYRTVK